MKYILPIFFVLFLVSCNFFGDDNSQQSQEITEEQRLKDELALKKRLKKLSEQRKEPLKKTMKVQAKRRQYLEDTKTIDSDSNKLNYYLSRAREYERTMLFKKAAEYAQKVLEIDPDNAEAKRIIRKKNKFYYSLTHGKKNNKSKQQMMKDLERINKIMSDGLKGKRPRR